MKVKDIMTREVVCAYPDMKISEVAKILFENRFHSMPVVNGKRLIGIVTENDFFSQKDDFLFLPEYINFLKEAKVVGGLPKEEKKKINQIINAKAKDIMTTDCVVVSPETEISDLIDLIKKTGFNSIPVVDSNNLILGIITIADIIELFKDNGLSLGKEISNTERSVDELVEEVNLWWNKKYHLVGKREIKTWKGSLVLAFIGGCLFFFIWVMAF